MSTPRVCERCGRLLSEAATGTICPACIAQLGHAPWLEEPAPEDPMQTEASLASPAAHSDDALSPATPHPSPARIHYFGDYELLEEIARGGMGVVYRARQISLNRLVALKMILAGELASPSAVQRFRAEAEAAASLQHPNIIAIHEVGEHEGQHYFSMDFVEGQNLAQRVRDGPLPTNQAAEYLEIIAEAVHFAHERGILHRDLKPSNVLLDAFGQPRVTDFGLAKQLSADSDLTESGQVLGSPNFMSPEQALGKWAEVARASDVYSLGAILYHALTGRPPFVAGTVVDTLRLVTGAEPVSPRLLNPSVPRDLETICLKCLEKAPKRRYGTAQELADDLRRFLRREPIRARRTSPLERTMKWAKRKPALAALAGVSGVAALALVGFGISVPAYRKAEQARIDEQTQRHKTEEALKQAESAQESEITQRRRAEAENQRATLNSYLASIAGAELARQNKNFERANRLLEECAPHLRNWEWHHLKRLCHSGFRTLSGHNTNVLATAFVGNGERLTSISADGVLLGWNAVTGLQDTTIQIWPKGIYIAAFSKDSSRLITEGANDSSRFITEGPSDSVIRVWEVATGTEVFAVKLTDSYVCAAAISANGELIAVASGATIRTNGQLIAVANGDKMIRVWDVTARQLVHSLRHTNEVDCLAFSPDGKRLGAGGGAFYKSVPGDVCVWDLDWASMISLSGITNTALCLDFSPDSELIAAAGFDQTVCVWSARTGELVHRFVHEDAIGIHSNAVNGIVFSPDSNRIASCGEDGTVKLWELATGIEERIYRTHSRRIRAIAFSPDGNRLASGGWFGRHNSDIPGRSGVVEAKLRNQPQTSRDSLRPGKIHRSWRAGNDPSVNRCNFLDGVRRRNLKRA